MLYFHFLCAKKISKYNMINMISKPGIFYKRRCDETEIEKVKEAYEKTKHHLDKITNATAWFNFVTSKVYHVDMSEKYYQDFELWVRSLVDEISGKDKYIHSYGFLFSPKHSTHTQSYHMDTYPDI